MLRTLLFWAHLTAGAAAAAVILMMSATGVALTYERQLVEWSERRLDVAPPPGGQALPVSSLLDRARAEGREVWGDFSPAIVTLRPDPEAVVQVGGGGRQLYLDPYTGEIVSTGFRRLTAFLDTMRGWHRWFAVDGDARRRGRAVTGAANLAFLFLLVSGLILWIPRKRTWRQVRQVVAFRRGLAGRARDFNWHNVLGIWCAIPLIVVASSATVISYAWASDVATGIAESWGAPRGPGRLAPDLAPLNDTTAGEASLDTLIASVGTAAVGWREIVVTIPKGGDDTVTMDVHWGYRGQPQLRETWEVARDTGRLVERATFADQRGPSRLRSALRFVHTGEYWGVPGQTVAGLVSLAAVLLGFTGVSLAIRRWTGFWRKRVGAARPAPPPSRSPAPPRRTR